MSQMQAQITSVLNVGGVNQYAWLEQQSNYELGGFVGVPGGRYGTTSLNYAVEMNNATLTPPFYAWLQERGYVQNQMVYEFQGVVSSSPPPPPPPTTCTGCEWLAAITAADCLQIVIDGTTAPAILFSADGITWGNPGEPVTICGHQYHIVFTLGSPPTLTLIGIGSGAQTYTGTFGCCGCNSIKFGFSSPLLCGTSENVLGPCFSLVTVQLNWVACDTTALCSDFCTALGGVPSTGCDQPYTNAPIPGYAIASPTGSNATLNAGFTFNWAVSGGGSLLFVTPPCPGAAAVSITCVSASPEKVQLQWGPTFLNPDCGGFFHGSFAAFDPFFASLVPYVLAFRIPSSMMVSGVGAGEECIVIFNYQG